MGYDKYRSKPKRVFDKNRKPKEKRLGEGLKVYVRNNDVDRALRKLNKMVNKEGFTKSQVIDVDVKKQEQGSVGLNNRRF